MSCSVIEVTREAARSVRMNEVNEELLLPISYRLTVLSGSVVVKFAIRPYIIRKNRLLV